MKLDRITHGSCWVAYSILITVVGSCIEVVSAKLDSPGAYGQILFGVGLNINVSYHRNVAGKGAWVVPCLMGTCDAQELRQLRSKSKQLKNIIIIFRLKLCLGGEKRSESITHGSLISK